MPPDDSIGDGVVVISGSGGGAANAADALDRAGTKLADLAPAVKQQIGAVMPEFGSVTNPIEVMIREHEHAGDALAQIRSLTENYGCLADACNTYRATFDSLQQLERDLHQHVHKENNILFPKAIRLERLLAGARA